MGAFSDLAISKQAQSSDDDWADVLARPWQIVALIRWNLDKASRALSEREVARRKLEVWAHAMEWVLTKSEPWETRGRYGTRQCVPLFPELILLWAEARADADRQGGDRRKGEPWGLRRIQYDPWWWQ